MTTIVMRIRWDDGIEIHEIPLSDFYCDDPSRCPECDRGYSVCKCYYDKERSVPYHYPTPSADNWAKDERELAARRTAADEELDRMFISERTKREAIWREHEIMRKRRVVQSVPRLERFRLAALRAINEGRTRDHVLWARAAGEAMWRNRHVPLIRRST